MNGRRRGRVIAGLVLALVGTVVPHVGAARPPLLDRTVQAVTQAGAALCRDLVPSPPGVCATLDGRAISPAFVDAYQQTWVHRALTLQRGLDDAASWTEATVPHTHNSTNSSAYAPTLSNLDANQVYSLRDQLRMDVRAVELDVHWAPSLFAEPGDGLQAAVLCHGEPVDLAVVVLHVGCTIDPPLRNGLAELRSWLDANPTEVVLLYLENNLDGDPAAHDAATRALAQHLGDLVARPPAGEPCAPMPMETSRATLRAAGHRVLIVGNCGPGAWATWVHDRGPRWKESGLGFGDDYPAPEGCEFERAAVGYGTNLIRRWEDSTYLSYISGGGGDVTVTDTQRMVRCGVNLVGFDQLTPADPRLAAAVWSWAPDEPANAAGTQACAAQGADGRFRARGCGEAKPYACTDGAGSWFVTGSSGAWDGGPAACAAAFPGSMFGAPPNGYRNALLSGARPAAVPEVWLAYRTAAGDPATWVVTPG